jgi:RHS repeat-associated protein
LVSIPVNILPAGTGAVKITLQRLNGTGTVWVDDVRCEEGVSRKEDITYYYHCDYLGSPRVMTDPLGNVIWRQDYYAFGGDYNTSATGNTHKFTGHVQDAATGQYYAKARYFTTNNGRWSQPEPLLKGVPGKAFLVNPQKLNPYVYCLNNPLKYFDPNGLIVKVSQELKTYVERAMKSKAFRTMYKALDERKDIVYQIRDIERLRNSKEQIINGNTIFEKQGSSKNIFSYIRIGSESDEKSINERNARIIKTLGHEIWHAIEQGILTDYETYEEMILKYYKKGPCSTDGSADKTGKTVYNEVDAEEKAKETKPAETTVAGGNAWYWLIYQENGGTTAQ